MSIRRRSRSGRPARSRTVGQAVVEFALVVPVLAALLLGIADFARWYTTAVAVEAASREAADFGAFSVANWADPASTDVTVAEMKRRACTAASSLTGYAEPSGTIGHADCTNPVFSYRLLPADTTTCGDPSTEPPCRVDVTLTYQFNLFFGV